MSEATSEDIFRPEALDYHRKHGDFPEGELLHLDRRWLDRAYWVLGFTVLAALVFCLVAPVHEYASGPAVVRLLGQTRLSAKTGGTVASVEAAPGQHVRPGDVLLRFDETEGQTALNHVEREIEIQTLKLLRDPTDQEARRSLAPLQGQREAAKAHLNESIIRSPIEGVVSDVRVRPWMHLMPGDVMVSLAKGDTHFSVVALLPGEFRPMLRVGMAMRFELSTSVDMSVLANIHPTRPFIGWAVTRTGIRCPSPRTKVEV